MTKPAIRLSATRQVHIPLQTLTVGRGSVLELEIHGAPEGLQNVQLHVGRMNSSDFSPVTATPMPDNRWSIYVSGLYFPDEGRIQYHLTGRDERDGSVWLGSGRIIILPSVLHKQDGEESIVPEDTYVRNPRTGLWHRLTVTMDTDGDMLPAITKKGITR